MIAYNLCYTTLIEKSKLEETRKLIGNQNITCTPTGDYFVKSSVKKGMLPKIIETLISNRQSVKDTLSKDLSESDRIIFEGRQLAFKIMANAV